MIFRIFLFALVYALVEFVPMSMADEDVGQHHLPYNTQTSVRVSEEFTAFDRAMKVGMEKMMANMHQSDMTGNPDVDFLAMMIPHHAGAVEMARLVLLYGKDPLVRQLAEEIVASQQAEITAMRGRLSILKKGANPKPGGFPALGGMRGTVTSNLPKQ